jgi:hypothetical protein
MLIGLESGIAGLIAHNLKYGCQDLPWHTNSQPHIWLDSTVPSNAACLVQREGYLMILKENTSFGFYWLQPATPDSRLYERANQISNP